MTVLPFSFPLANGLHARPASLLREACLGFAADVVFRNKRKGSRAAAGSVLELVASGTASGDPCLLEVSGPQEKDAVRALRVFLGRDLPHADDSLPPPASAGGSRWLPPVFLQGGGRCLQGRTLAPGIGRARAAILKKRRSWPKRFAAGKMDKEKELQLFQNACRELEADLAKKADTLKDRNAAGILQAHLAILSDPGFRERVAGLIARQKMPAGAAIEKTIAHFARILRQSSSAYLRERAEDLEDIAAQLEEKLYGRPAARPRRPAGKPGVLVAAALAPSELLALDRRNLRGLVLGEVSPTSHTAILARSYGIPAVSLPPEALAQIRAGTEVVVDGRRGLAVAAPGAALKRYYRLEKAAEARREQRLAGMKKRPAKTGDGIRVEIAANIGSAAELEPAWRQGAEAVGLFRSEVLFLDREAPPGEDEQYEAYAGAARSARGRPVIIRTLDVGGDKSLPYLALPQEDNPYLGYRAVRFYGEHEELVRCQLRAILRAACYGPLKIMVPMVTVLEEVRLVRRLLAEAAAELRQRRTPHAESLELGIMVETPAAALALDRLAAAADFFSIGSNDLLQYFLAVDRGSTRLAGLYDPLHPAFLRLLSQAAVQARKAKRWLGICGEMAGRSDCLPLLVGLGFDELSMASPLIPAVKERLGHLDGGECRALLRHALACSEAAEVAALLNEFNGRGSGGGEVVTTELVRLGSPSRTRGEAVKELCDMLELSGRLSDSSALEEAVWKREETFATNLGFGFALPHGKSTAVRAASIAFLRPARPLRWGGSEGPMVRGVLMIAIPAVAHGEEHLRLIARLSRRLMHKDFRAALLTAKRATTVAALVRSGLKTI